jgi:hypothetical protein
MNFFNYLLGAFITIVGYTVAFCIENPPIAKLVAFILVIWFIWSSIH